MEKFLEYAFGIQKNWKYECDKFTAELIKDVPPKYPEKENDDTEEES